MVDTDTHRTGDQALVRQINLSLIMNNLRENAPISRASLAERTGLNKTTVSSLVQELIDNSFVHETGLESGTPGRPGMLLTLDPAAGHIVSAEIGVDFVSAICTDFAPQVVWQHKESIAPDMGQHVILDRVLALLRAADQHGTAAGESLLGVALGAPGLIDTQTGTVLFAPNLGWRNVQLEQSLQETFSAPVFVDNEANLAALGEHYFGTAKGYDEVLYISAGVGLGGGIVHSGRMFRGVSGTASEFGHMTMDEDGIACNCGNRGCWETQVSQAALHRYIAEDMEMLPSVLAAMTENDLSNLTVPMVVDAARDGDEVALNALSKVGYYLGCGIASLINVFNPQLVVFGGALSLASEFLLPVVETELERRALEWNQQATRVLPAQHGIDACVMGGIATVYQAILAEPASMRYRAN